MNLFEAAIRDLASFDSSAARGADDLLAALAPIVANAGIVLETLAALGSSNEGRNLDDEIDALVDAIGAATASLVHASALELLRYDADRGDLFSARRGDRAGRPDEVRVGVDGGEISEALATGRALTLGSDSAHERLLGQLGEATGERAASALIVPVAGSSGEPLGLICALRGHRDASDHVVTRPGDADSHEFTPGDVAVVEAAVPALRSILECARAMRSNLQKQRAVTALMHATSSITRSSLDLEETLRRVMDEAKELMNADRSTLWLVDREANQLWTRILTGDAYQEIRIPMNAGFAGLVATTGQPVNIPFDLYSHPNAFTAKQVDQRTGYRTCSLLCLPVLNADGELIGVTQLVNKKRPGVAESYDPTAWPEAPDCWKASFTRADQEYMAAFNQQAGVALQNAKLFATVKQQEQMQRDILRNLSNGVVATDDAGSVVATNESALAILGLGPDAAIEGQRLVDLLRLADADFAAWLAASLAPEDDKARQQYYPEQVVVAGPTEQRSVNLSISTMADTTEPNRVRGALVVMDDISHEKRLKTTMYRYMTQELAEQLLQSADGVRLGGDRKHVSVLFSDIRSYTTLTERMDPEDVVKLLNEYFEAMVEAIFNYKGTLDKYIGDAIMAVYGSPLVIEDHAWCAVQSAIEMRHRLADFNARRAAGGEEPIRIGIGINSDEVVSGNIGSSKRMEFTAIGDGINLGSRLEGVSKIYGCDVIISDETRRLCGDRVICRELDTIRVKGKNEPVSIFELVEIAAGPLARPVSEAKRRQMDSYGAGREFYDRREFRRALTAFERALEATPGDPASILHIERCKNLIENAPPEAWSGVWVLKEK